MAEEVTKAMGKHDGRHRCVELIGVDGDRHVEVRVTPGQERVGEAAKVVHHIKMGRGRFARMPGGKVFSLHAASFIGFESADAEERMRRKVP